MIEDIEFASFADDTTPYSTKDCIDDVISSLTKASEDIFKWFLDNEMKVNPEKCKLIVNAPENVSLKLSNNSIESSNTVKLLGVEIDSNLTFKGHINSVCKKANQKLHALARISPFMDLNQKRLLFNAFFKSQFAYCPLAWMCHSRELNYKINRIHEKCLRIVYNDKECSFQELLDKDGSVCTHHRNLQTLCVEMFKVVNGLSPKIFTDLFEIRDQSHYNFRKNDYFAIPKVKTVLNGSESISVLGPKTWNSLPEELKQINCLNAFKISIKKWKPPNCSCRICKQYIQGVGFI